MDDDSIGQEDFNKNYIEGSIFDYWTTPEDTLFGSPLSRFARLLEQPDEEIDLAEAAMIIASQEYSGLNEAYYLTQLDDLADEVRPLLVIETNPLKNIESLNYFLYTLKGFRGNETEYNDRRNSFLNDVLERKTGIPISLSLLYMELGKRLGLHFEGIGLPGHFIIRYRELAPQASGRDFFGSNFENLERQEGANYNIPNQPEEIFLDPFNGGAILTEEDLLELVRERNGRALPIRPILARPYTKRQFLTRMLLNLKAVCVSEQDWVRALEFQAFMMLLNPQSSEEKRDRGLLYIRGENYGRAIADLRNYLRKNPNAQDANTVRRQLGLAFDELVKRN